MSRRPCSRSGSGRCRDVWVLVEHMALVVLAPKAAPGAEVGQRFGQSWIGIQWTVIERGTDGIRLRGALGGDSAVSRCLSCLKAS